MADFDFGGTAKDYPVNGYAGIGPAHKTSDVSHRRGGKAASSDLGFENIQIGQYTEGLSFTSGSWNQIRKQSFALKFGNGTAFGPVTQARQFVGNVFRSVSGGKRRIFP